MTLRQHLFDLARHFGLNPAQGQALHNAAGMDAQPAAANRLAVPALTLLAAVMAGFGVILWIAANWGLWERPVHFALLGALLLASSVGSWALARFRAASLALGVLAGASVGGLLAYFGQTYQTGADPWQLFALWAGLTLPLCLGLRHRALWMPWSLIANTAISLWAWAQMDRWASNYEAPQLLSMLAAFAASLLVSVALYPAWRRVTGSSALSHRVAMLWTVLLIGSLSVAQFLTLMGHAVALLPGLLLFGAMVAWYGTRRHFDVLILSAASLGVLVLLFVFLTERLLRLAGYADPFLIMLLGIFAMLGLAGAVAWIMRRYRAVTGTRPVDDEREKHAPQENDIALTAALDTGVAHGWWSSRAHALAALVPDSGERPWSVVLLTALGAWLAVVPFVIALGLFAWNTSSAALTLGALFTTGTVLLLRQPKLPLFLEQMAYAVLITGLAFLVIGAGSLWGEREALWLLFAVLMGLVVFLREPWLQLLLGAALCWMMPAVIASLLYAQTDFWMLDQTWTLAWLPALIALLWPLAMLRSPARWLGLPLVRFAARREAFWAGWMLTVLVQQAASAGMTFMMAGMLGGGGMTPTAWGNNVWTEAAGLQFWQWWLPLSSGLFAAAAYAIGAQRWPLLHQPALGLLAVLLVVASWFLPSLGIPLCFLATAAVTQRWRLALAAAAAVAWVIGAIYYQTDYLLVHKAISLIGLALVTGALAVWLRHTQARQAPLLSASMLSIPESPAPAAAPDRLRRHLVLLVPAAMAAILLPGVLNNEALIRDGERLLVKLAPVDPRSLLQGDYMALAFDLGPATPTGGMDESLEQARHVVFQRAANGLATARRLELDDRRPPLASDERRMPLSRKSGRTVLVTDAWYFKEGTGERWAQAAYGEFRLRADGRALLVGLADENMQPIPQD